MGTGGLSRHSAVVVVLAFDLDRLEEGAPIAFGWTGDRPGDRHPTEFRFSVEQ